MPLQPWYKVVFPREDLRDGKPLDASEFAVHLDQVRDGRANPDYQDPARFFARTFMTRNLTGVAAEVVRRLSGIKTETSALFNMTTQFGGGKTHSLTLLYHLATSGDKAKAWPGVAAILDKAQVPGIPKAATGVFVGTEFDSIKGRGKKGEPLRKTPWGELAFQIGGADAFAVVAEHEKQQTAPSGEVIREFLPKKRPCLILIDEVMNYVSRYRKSGLAAQFYNFLHNLSEEVRGQNNVVLVVSIPASELEMTTEDQADYARLKKMLDRLGKAVIMSAEAETAEIIRRRLFEWDGMTKEAEKTVALFADWVVENRTQVPGWFPVDNAGEAFRATYPFHPMVLSVFERKWQQLPRFQQTRGILRLLALWVSRAYQEGYKGGHHDPLIGLGTAPLDDSMFRTAAFEQLGESKLEGAVTTDIAGRKTSHAIQMDTEASEEVRGLRLHRKVATAIFFESNGGMMKAEATVPEIRLAVGEPGMNIGHVETILEGLADRCYYLSVGRNRYRFGPKETLVKRFTDRRASVNAKAIDDRMQKEVETVFAAGTGVERVYFPEKSNAIPDRPILTLAVLPPDVSMADAAATKKFAKDLTWECGKSGRTFKSAIIWCVAEVAQPLQEEARKALAWEAIEEESDEVHLDDDQKRQLAEHVKRSRRDLREAVWRTYKYLLLLDSDNEMRTVDLGLVNSSQAATMLEVILKRLREDGDLEKDPSPNFLVRKWPGFVEWSTKAVRDAFFASPAFPRLLNADAVKETVARGVSQGVLAYVGKLPNGRYEPFVFERELTAMEVEISDEVFIIKADEAKKHIEPPKLTTLQIVPAEASIKPKGTQSFQVRGLDQHGRPMTPPKAKWSAEGGKIDGSGNFKAAEEEGRYSITATAGDFEATASVVVAKEPKQIKQETFEKVAWTGQIPAQKWMNFYTKVFKEYARGTGLKITISFDVAPDGGLTQQQVEEVKQALRALGLDDDVKAS